MSVTAPVVLPAPAVTDRPPTIHLYSRDPKYRKSGMGTPQPGDIALCGFVKRTPYRPVYDRPATCVVCADLAHARDWTRR